MRLRFVSALACVAAAFVCASCASSPKAGGDGKREVSAKLASEKDFLRKGVDNANNPFIVPLTLMDAIGQGHKEFVPLALDFSLPESEEVYIEANVKDASGEVVAKLCSKADVVKFWEKVMQSGGQSEVTKRKLVLDWYYPNDSTFTVKAGKHQYFIACQSDKEIERPATVELSVTVGEEPPQFFTFDLLPQEKKK